MLRDAGAVLIAKLTTGELASGDQWFGGQTKNPWNPTQGSSGSSAGPSSATAAGCVAFGIGTETSGSILSPSARCGLAGLRPTFGRISRYGVMALSWTQDRLGPMCRYAEDCAIVMQAIARPDGRDMSVSDIPFNWNAHLDVKKLRVGYIKESFDELTNASAKKNAEQTLETLRSLGVTKFVPLTVPEVAGQRQRPRRRVARVLRRACARRPDEGSARRRPPRTAALVPAVEYLRAQRVRMMMMMKLAEATANFDVYIVASNNTGGGGRGEGRGGDGPAAVRPRTGRRTTTGGGTANRRVRRRRRSATRTWPTSPAIRRSTFRTGLPTGVADQRHVLRQAVRGNGAARARQGVPGRGRVPLEEAAGARRKDCDVGRRGRQGLGS